MEGRGREGPGQGQDLAAGKERTQRPTETGQERRLEMRRTRSVLDTAKVFLYSSI